MTSRPSITAHCIVKNEEVFVGYVIRSVINHVDSVIVFDTGSTDAAPDIIRKIALEYPGKIVFEEKGPCDKVRHTELRQEMLDRTRTDWFMILDGDEVWTERGMGEALILVTSADSRTDFLLAPFRLCVGDIFHESRRSGSYEFLGRRGNFALRFIRRIPGIHWSGAYGGDTIVDSSGALAWHIDNSRFLNHGFWHLTHLTRSAQDDSDYSSGGSRSSKRRLTYFLIGRRIGEQFPAVFLPDADRLKLPFFRSLFGFLRLVVSKFSL